ncbi:DUF3152 domain-containing protein [Lapillicoccus jejuensis]|uniref:Uncharacterized protein DUF3152 n=1 Tax=Lapillicoccus jejuensis TaxID=402171 RepID=A0A542E3M0_9MICO|nr:DUF3152 domain-containing protein [Lapillicoccus jejuensis]TQJ09844.1 uncharacterized protein DUF3152 [Lapillicoccus jejuensis]
MTTTTQRPDPAVRQRSAAARRRRMRLRRTVVVAILLLVVGTVLARRFEDAGTTTAATALGSAQVLAGTSSAAADGVVGGAGAARASGSGAAGASSALTPAPSAGASATTAPRASAAARADDGPPAPTPSPASTATEVAVPASGNGVVTPLEIPAGPVATAGRTVRYSVELEGGLPVAGADVARTVMTVLTDPRGWQARDGVRFVPVSPAELARGAGVDIRVTLASPSLTARLCAPLDVTLQQVSCWNGSRSVLNLTRWMLGSSTYGSDLAAYRIYLVSHEVGHGLGHNHVHCPGPGRPSPVMVQQTKTLEGCTAQPWPTGA